MVSPKYSFELKSDLSELDHLCQHLTKFGHGTGLNITKPLVMEYWSFGVMGENQTGEYKPCFRAYHDMIIFSVKVIGQKRILGGACNSF
jgi:hypothetical protein